ncbi:hypothetical protein EMCRGX_G012716 [Ephydatia muelleri]
MQWSGNAATDINDRAPPRTAYINIADDEYAEQDFGVEDAADNDEYADKDFENLVKQFRVDEKMCYFHSQGSSNELHVEIEPVIDKDAFIHITSYPEDVYFPEDCGIILNKLTIRLTQVSHLAQPSSSLLKWDGSKFERLSSQIRAVSHLGSTALKYCRICMADKNDSLNIICEQRNLMQAQCRLCKLNLK